MPDNKLFAGFADLSQPDPRTVVGNQRALSFHTPTLLITEESDASSPTTSTREDASATTLLQHPKLQYLRDEDANSTAPLLGSGSATPVGEEPVIPPSFCTYVSADFEKPRFGEEICLSPLDQDEETGAEELQLDYPFVRWPWPIIRTTVFALLLAAILGCFGTSMTMIAFLPSVCNLPTEWWQGRTFYKVPDPAFLDNPAVLDYLQKDLLIDVVHINRDFWVDLDNETEMAASRNMFVNVHNLVGRLEDRNMSLVVDVHVNVYSTNYMSEENGRRIEHSLMFLLEQGIHGLFIHGLEQFVQQEDLWERVALWKTAIDRFSSDSNHHRILIVSSHFLDSYEQNHSSRTVPHLLRQFDLVSHDLDLSSVPSLSQQIRDGLRWNGDVDSPWIIWDAKNGPVRAKDECAAVGSLMFLLSLPGSATLTHGDSISFQEDPSDPSPSRDPAASCAPNASLQTVERMIQIRREAPPLHVNAVVKYQEGVLVSRSHNYRFHLVGRTALVERHYPRRHRYLTIVNLGAANATLDLSSVHYGGRVLLSSSGNVHGYVQLNRLHLQPDEGLLFLLDK